MKNKHVWILLAGIVLICAALLLLDFRVAGSSANTKELTFTTDMGDNLPASMQRRDKISIVLVGEGPMVGALQKALAEQMAEAGIWEIELAREFEDGYQNPVLVVKVGKPGPIWTPLLAMGQASVHVGYASDGDTTFMESAEETHTSISKPDVANMYAEFEVDDRSWGLISRLGYYHFLADYFAQKIVTLMKEVYGV